VDVPFDLHTAEVETQIFDVPKHSVRTKFEPPSDIVEKAADLLLDAKSPVLFAGGGVNLSDASDEMLQLSSLLGAPIITSIAGSSSFSGSDPRVAGFIGSYGLEGANRIANEADILFAVGTRFEEEETAIWIDSEVLRIPPTKLIQADIDPEVIGRNYPVEMGLTGDAKITSSKLIDAITRKLNGSKRSDKRIEELEEDKKQWLEKLAPEMTSNDLPINPRAILKALEGIFPENGILLVDPSWSRIGLLQQLFMPGKNKCHIVGGLLPIGWSTSAALGVAVAKPNSKIVALTGDGGFLMAIQSVFAAVQYNLPITWVIINNSAYNALHVLQTAYFDKSVGSKFEKAGTGDQHPADFSAIGRAFGAAGERIEQPDKIKPAITKALSSSVPYVLDFVSSGEKSRLIRTRSVTWSHFWSERRKRKQSQK
jgi:acetolactate synthase-1/2/3 large subunit